MLNKRIAYLYEYKLTTFERIKGSSAVVVSPREYASMIAGVASDLRAPRRERVKRWDAGEPG